MPSEFFGDAMRPDLLHAAGIEDAQMLVVAIDEREHITELVRQRNEDGIELLEHIAKVLCSLGASDSSIKFSLG